MLKICDAGNTPKDVAVRKQSRDKHPRDFLAELQTVGAAVRLERGLS
jgi:hypothetical protein